MKLRWMYRAIFVGLILIFIEVLLLISGGKHSDGDGGLFDLENIENLNLLHFDFDDEDDEIKNYEPVMPLDEDTSIRVVIKNSGFQSIYHKEIQITCEQPCSLVYGKKQINESCPENTMLSITADSEYFKEASILRIIPQEQGRYLQLLNVKRSYGKPTYRGIMEIHKTAEGLLLINELPFEEYLYAIVPSEMPSSYPMEALKAQAISARTFAYRYLLYPGYPAVNAHLDDSTTYQVYNNIQEQQRTNRAVDETKNMVLFTVNGEPVESYYYSTSCGVGADGDIWGNVNYPAYLEARPLNEKVMKAYVDKDKSPLLTDLKLDYSEEKSFTDFIEKTGEKDFEKEENWYRWSYQVDKLDVKQLCKKMKNCYETDPDTVQTLYQGTFSSRPIKEFETIQDMKVSERGRGGDARTLLIYAEDIVYKVSGGNTIRKLLLNNSQSFLLQDGSYGTQTSLLPSAFFVLNTGKVSSNVVGYTLVGGGLGHGVGMSQNGAKNMAAADYNAEEILNYFYNDCIIYEGG